MSGGIPKLSAVSRGDDFFERVLQAAQSATVVVDRAGTITFVSRAGEEMLGYAESDLLGRHMAEFIDPSDLEESLTAFTSIQGDQTRWPPALIALLGPDGSTVPTEVSGHGTFDDDVIGGAVYSVHRMDETMHLHRILAAMATGDPLSETLRLVTEMVGVPPLHLDTAVLHDRSEDGSRFTTVAAGALAGTVRQLLADPPDGAPWAADRLEPVGRADAPLLTLVEDLPVAARQLLSGTHHECWVSPLGNDASGVIGVLVVVTRQPTLPGTTIRQRMRRARDVCELAFVQRDHEDQLRHAALHDGLTNIPNRARFFDALEHGVGRRGGPLTGVLYLDLDGFKPLNDTHGHGFGDRVLVEVASRIDGALRPHDLAARLGGDEFAVLLEDLGDEVEAAAIADRVLAAVSAPLDIDGVAAAVGASVGVAVGSSTGDRARLLHAADQAMYEAKRAGAGTVRVTTL